MRLIDADAIELRYSIGMLDPDGVVCIPMKDVRKSIANTPTIDAVPVVLCRDCKYYDKHGYKICALHSELPSQYSSGVNIYMEKDDFCSYGERKTDE